MGQFTKSFKELAKSPEIKELLLQAYSTGRGDCNTQNTFDDWFESLTAVEIWIPVLIGVHSLNKGQILPISHKTYSSQELALKYKCQPAWKVSHATKVWPKS